MTQDTSLGVREAQRHPHITGCGHRSCLPSLEGESLLLKTPLILDAGHRELNLKLTRKLSPCWLPYTVPEAAEQRRDINSLTQHWPLHANNTNLLREMRPLVQYWHNG